MKSAETVQLVERSFFEALRVQAVSMGVTPDIVPLIGDPNGWIQYQQNLKAIKNSLGFAVEVFGPGIPASRGQIDTSTISLEFVTVINGDYGLDSVGGYETNEGWQETNGDLVSYNIFLDVILSTDSSKVEKTLLQILHEAIPTWGPLSYYDGGGDMLVFLRSSRAENDLKKNLLRQRFAYEIPDALFYEPQPTLWWPSINTINLQTNLALYLGIS